MRSSLRVPRATLRAAAAGTRTSASTSSAPITFRLTTIDKRQQNGEEVIEEGRIGAGDSGERRAEAVEQEVVVLPDEHNRHQSAHGEQEEQVGVGHREQAAEQHRLDLMHVELPRERPRAGRDRVPA